MKKALITILALTLVSGCLSACGKEKQDDIVRIEASNAAGNATGEERKYEDTNKEPVVRPDQREKETNSSEEEQQQEVDTSEIDTSIYGNWFEDDGSAFSIYKENDEIMFSGYDAETDRGLFGTVQSDEETYIEFKQNKELEETETVEEEQTIPEDINVDELGDGYSYDPEKGLQKEINVTEQYGSEEEFNKAMAEESKQIEEGTINEDNYEIIRYNIDSIEIQTDIKQVVMTISNETKTYILRKNIE